MKWTVARFPSGNWSAGGKPTDPDYAECEVFVVDAPNCEAAKKKAQSKRSRMRRGSGLLPDKNCEF